MTCPLNGCFRSLNEDMGPMIIKKLTCSVCLSGLPLNLAKSQLILVGDVLNASAFASILGCKLGALPVSYLGLYLGSSFNAKVV